ncbi:uncharacterized protein LOC128678395 [Plodia interpunctella]|uniref:uncharacterized protein LOC128678395 n=1 Tax=Plodia interpunctella TaxID=58824 RepID=UPI002368E0F5|nr:uncharacterized protein LOC128678395 [Plodia interpunctella]
MASCLKATLVIILIILIFYEVNSLKMIFQQLKVTYANDKYIKEGNANIRHYRRNGDYYINIWGTINHTWANNITIHVIVTEFLHNEYRRSFIEFHYKLCDLINHEPMFGQMLVKKGVVCPLPKGQYKLMNMTVQS